MRLLTTAENAVQAELIVARLAEAGIEALAPGGVQAAYDRNAGPSDVYVEEEDLDRAREALKADEGMSEAELVQAEEADAAARQLDEPQGTHPEAS